MITVTDQKEKWDDLSKDLKSLKRIVCAVGLLEPEGARAVPGTSLSMADLGVVHEYGVLGRIPARPWLNGYFEELGEERLRSAIGEVMGEVMDGKQDTETAYNRLGAALAGGIQERIARQIPPPNAPSTIASKGSSTPLIDTGAFRQSISGRAVRG